MNKSGTGTEPKSPVLELEDLKYLEPEPNLYFNK